MSRHCQNESQPNRYEWLQQQNKKTIYDFITWEIGWMRNWFGLTNAIVLCFVLVCVRLLFALLLFPSAASSSYFCFWPSLSSSSSSCCCSLDFLSLSFFVVVVDFLFFSYTWTQWIIQTDITSATNELFCLQWKRIERAIWMT